jgi:soluble lytic murein transglycosylase-like protein
MSVTPPPLSIANPAQSGSARAWALWQAIAALTWLALATTASAQSQIYINAEAHPGAAVVLSNFRSDETPQLLIAAEAIAAPLPIAPALRSAPPPPRPPKPDRQEIKVLIDRYAAEMKVSPRLLDAVIHVESNFDAHAVSAKGAIGLMQLMPGTASRFGAVDPYSAADNIRAGAAYLKWLGGLFQGNLELVLAAYNSGEQTVIKAGRRIPPIAETRAYVPRVIAYFRHSDNPHDIWP